MEGIHSHKFILSLSPSPGIRKESETGSIARNPRKFVVKVAIQPENEEIGKEGANIHLGQRIGGGVSKVFHSILLRWNLLVMQPPALSSPFVEWVNRNIDTSMEKFSKRE